MPLSNWKKEILTIPNLLSIFRLILIPVYIGVYLNATEPIHYVLAAGILLISCLTDLLDGKIARKFNMISNVGKVLDPLADKATQFALMVCLLTTYPQLLSMMILFIIKEVFQLIAFLIYLRKGKALDGALMIGKICTTVLFSTLILMLLVPTLSNRVTNILTIVNSVLLFITFLEYVQAFFGKNNQVKDINRDDNTNDC